MAMKLYSDIDIQNIADSIRAKNGTSDTYKVSQMSTAIDNLPTGANIVNGIIEQYKAETSTISANTFVEFINKTTIDTIGNDTQLSNGTYSYEYASAVALNENKVFVAHRYSNYLYGIVCTISGTTITTGTDTQLSTYYSSYDYASAVALSEDKVFIAHSGGGSNESSSSYLYGIVCNINGTTITYGTDTQLSTEISSHQYASSVKLSENKVFIAHRNGSYLGGIVCTISDTTITAGTDVTLSTGSVSYQYASAVALNDSKVFIAHRSGDYLYGIVCTIDDTTITKGTDTKLSTGTGSYQNVSAVALSEDKAFFAHSSNSSSMYLYAMVCTISGTSIVTSSEYTLSSIAGSYSYVSVSKLNKDKVFVTYRGGSSNYYLSGVICNINGNSINKGTEAQLSTGSNSHAYTSSVALSEDKVFVAHASDNSNHYLNGVVCNQLKDTIQEATTKINGLTKTQCTTSTAGDVWILD